MRSAEVHLHGKPAGHLMQDEEGYTFTYAPPHLQAEFTQPVSLTLPLRGADTLSLFRWFYP